MGRHRRAASITKAPSSKFRPTARVSSGLKYFTNSPHGAQSAGRTGFVGNKLDGTTFSGGANGNGTCLPSTPTARVPPIFTVSVRSKTRTATGRNPFSSLVLSGGARLEQRRGGGTDGGRHGVCHPHHGTGYTNLYRFSRGGWGTGGDPRAGLVLSGSTLYGTAKNGGSSGNGTIFKINTDGTGYTNLYAFSASVWNNTNNDGMSIGPIARVRRHVCMEQQIRVALEVLE